jgi:pimeloyl-ACP methyl ester carboxylesterase
LLPQNISLFCFDFSGCGLSEGEYISLGWYERDDVALIVEHLRQSNTVSTIGLWGRSMGAVTALMHADRDPSIAGLVLDSPFSSLRQLAEDICEKYSSLPKFVMSGALALIKSSIKERANFDINDLNPLKNHVK